MDWWHNLKASLRAFSAIERRDILFYILGTVVYKFGIEAFGGSITALATDRYDYDALLINEKPKTFQRLGIMQGLNLGMQCMGSILVGPLVKKAPIKNVLAAATVLLGVTTAILLAVDAGYGGQFLPSYYRGLGNHPINAFWYYGKYETDAIIPIYAVCGISNGMVDMIRRVIPRDMVGGNVEKLQQLDSLVHIFYTLAGASGAFCAGFALIPLLGNNRAFIITPICCLIASVFFWCISHLGYQPQTDDDENLTRKQKLKKALRAGLTPKAVGNVIWSLVETLVVGAKILFTSRNFIWLIPSYGIASYAHRYIENGVIPQVARRYLGVSSWGQIMVGGANFGELIGAMIVFLAAKWFKTPILWLRTDSLMMLIMWFFPRWWPRAGDYTEALRAAALMIPVSLFWAAGDVSLNAYIQASLARTESPSNRVSALNGVVCFLYCFYVTTYAIAGILLGRYLDKQPLGNGIRHGLVWTAGVQFSVIAALIFGSTFIPKGSLAWNPEMIGGLKLDEEIDTGHMITAETKPVSPPGSEEEGTKQANVEAEPDALEIGGKEGP